MTPDSSDTLTVIREIADRFIPGCKILLFGSRARKDHDPDSDFDFLLITEETFDLRKKRTLQSQIRKELAKQNIPADILIQSQEEVNSKKEIFGHIIKQALREGVAL